MPSVISVTIIGKGCRQLRKIRRIFLQGIATLLREAPRANIINRLASELHEIRICVVW
jgi:hypothetical protein